MSTSLKRGALVFPLIAPMLLAGCVSQSKYDDLQAQNQQLQQQNSSLTAQVADAKAQVARLQGGIKYAVNSDLLFASGSWKLKPQGANIISNLAAKLAPTQQNKILIKGFTDNAPIGPALAKEVVTSNQILSQKRAEAVMQFLISKGLSPDLVTAQGLGEADPVASNATAQGRAKNRRVELSLAGS